MIFDENPLEEVFSDQLACADMVVVSKSDMMEREDLTEVLKLINKQSQTSVEAIPVVHGQLDPKVFLGLGAAVENDFDSRPSFHDGEEHEHDDFDTVTVSLSPVDVPESLTERVKRALMEIGVLRIKGVVEIRGKSARFVIQGVGERVDSYYDRPWNFDEVRNSQLVVIGLKGFDIISVEKILIG